METEQMENRGQAAPADVRMENGQIVRNGVSYGCHTDLCDDEEPDGCVIDYGAHGDCIYATFASGRKRTSRWTCKHWRPVEAPQEGPSESNS